MKPRERWEQTPTHELIGLCVYLQNASIPSGKDDMAL